jgi:GNAT superfamily N-acetyltransferase
MLKHLDGGLILRSISEGCASDRETLPQFYSATFGDAGDESPLALDAWTRDLLSGQHPTVTGDDIWVVVDPTQNDKIVSALLLIPQTWHYDGVPVGVGRIELVATDKEYRRRGLVRAQMDVAHERSESHGHLMQGITGIGHYYRRFGYAMGLDLGIRSIIPLSAVPELGKDAKQRFTLRRAANADILRLVEWDAYRARQGLVSHPRDETLWHYELNGRNHAMPFALYIYIIVNEQGQEVGYVGLRAPDDQKFFGVYMYVVGEQSSYLDTYEDVLREIKAFIDTYYQDKSEFKPDYLYFDSGQHPALDLLISKTWGAVKRPDVNLYAWYLRVENMARFLKHIAPVLERRLEHSGAHRYTGTLTISFYDLTGVEIEFTNGQITDVNQRRFDIYEGDAKFPYHTFLNIVFGHRTFEELQLTLPEIWVTRKASVLLTAMFPRQRSTLLPLA